MFQKFAGIVDRNSRLGIVFLIPCHDIVNRGSFCGLDHNNILKVRNIGGQRLQDVYCRTVQHTNYRQQRTQFFPGFCIIVGTSAADVVNVRGGLCGDIPANNSLAAARKRRSASSAKGSRF